MSKPKMHILKYLVLDELEPFILTDRNHFDKIVSLLCCVYDMRDEEYLWFEYMDVDEKMDENPKKFVLLQDFANKLKEHYPKTVKSGGVSLYVK